MTLRMNGCGKLLQPMLCVEHLNTNRNLRGVRPNTYQLIPASSGYFQLQHVRPFLVPILPASEREGPPRFSKLDHSVIELKLHDAHRVSYVQPYGLYEDRTSVPVHNSDDHFGGIIKVWRDVHCRRGVAKHEVRLLPLLAELSPSQPYSDTRRDETCPSACCAEPTLDVAVWFVAQWPLWPVCELWQEPHEKYEHAERQDRKHSYAETLVTHENPLFATCGLTPHRCSLRNSSDCQVAA